MKVIGFNFSKISVEKKGPMDKQPEVKTSVNIPEIKEVPSDLFKTKEVPLEVTFSYLITYEPKIAELSFEGSLMLLIDPKEAKEILKNWKEKNMQEEFKVFVFNVILRKANIKALQLEDEMGLPAHFQMPSLKIQKQEKPSK